MDEDVTIYRNNEAVRQRRLNGVRTPTAVVSEVFGFLNDDPSASIDVEEENDLTMSDAEVDRLFSNLDVKKADIEECVHHNLLLCGNERDKFTADFKSKDSGFASLERQRCEPNSLYESFLENDDDNEDAVDSISSNEITASISESLYDDMDISMVPRSISMEVKSTKVDDENENAIASSAEKFNSESENKNAYPSEQESENTNITDQSHKIAKKGTHITVVMVNKGILGRSSTTNDNSHHRFSTGFLPDEKNSITSESSSDTIHEFIRAEEADSFTEGEDSFRDSFETPVISESVSLDKVKQSDIIPEGNESVVVTLNTIKQSNITTEDFRSTFEALDSVHRPVLTTNGAEPMVLISDSAKKPSITPRKKTGNVFNFVITPNKSETDLHLGQCGIMDSYYCSNSVAAGASFDFVESSAKNCFDNNYDVNAAISPSSFGEDDSEDVITRDLEHPTNTSCETYATIDIEPQENAAAADRAESLENEVENLVEDSPLRNTDSESEGPLKVLLDEHRDDFQEIPEQGPMCVIRGHKLEKNPSAELASDDSSDEDVGIYAESFRRSHWVRLSQEGNLNMKIPNLSKSDSSKVTTLPLLLGTDSVGSSNTDSPDGEAVPVSSAADEVFIEPLADATSHIKAMHKRSDSVATTASESEFKCQYVSRRKCLIQRNDSQQEYHRLSSRVYDQDKQVVVHRSSDSDDLGLHLLDSHPAFITSVDPGSAAERAGITEGQILVSVNDRNVLTTSHVDIVELIHNSKGTIKLGVANSDFQPVRDLQATVMSGYMHKLGNFGLKFWKKRFFVLRQDNCLYYYKNEQESDPLGAIPLGGYTISRHTETSKDYCFKAEKYGGRTYYFIADNRDQMTEWVGALTEAAARSKKRKESFLSVSSHNVGLPALHILKPECAGFLGKLSPSRRSWKRRYCVLKDACVYYYKDKNSVSALGVAHLHGYTVDVENFQRRKFSFSLQPPDKKMRIFYFSTDNDTDKKRWVESLIHAIQRWVRVDKEVEC